MRLQVEVLSVRHITSKKGNALTTAWVQTEAGSAPMEAIFDGHKVCAGDVLVVEAQVNKLGFCDIVPQKPLAVAK